MILMTCMPMPPEVLPLTTIGNFWYQWYLSGFHFFFFFFFFFTFVDNLGYGQIYQRERVIFKLITNEKEERIAVKMKELQQFFQF